MSSAARIAGQDVGEPQAARSDLGEIVIEPAGERRVEIDDVAAPIDREEAGWCVVEIVDRVLELLEDVLLPLAVAGDVGDGPHRGAGLDRVAERPHPQPQPSRRLATRPGDPHLLLKAAAFLRRLAQAIDRFGDFGVADEHALDRAHFVLADRVGKQPVGGVGEQHPPGGIGDDDAVIGVVDDPLEHRAAGFAGRHPQHAGGEREQGEHPDHRENREEDRHVGPGGMAADQHQTGSGGNQENRHQQDQRDAAAAFAPRNDHRAEALRRHVEPNPPIQGTHRDS